MQLNIVEAYMVIYAGIYYIVPKSSQEYFRDKWLQKILQHKMITYIWQIFMVLVAILIFLYSPWYALSAAIWYFAIAYLIRDHYRRKRDKELCNVLSVMLKQLCNILGSGQLLVPALCQLVDINRNTTLKERLSQLITALHNNLDLFSILEYSAKSDQKFDELWAYFHRIIVHGLWNGMSMVPLCEAFQKCVEQRILAEEKIINCTAGATLSSTLMAILPGFGIIMGILIGANPLQILLNKNLGGILIFFGSICVVLGLLWSHRIIIRAVDGA